jgi:4-hydroxy-tetrahydrodipicolinate reductase
VPLRLVVNGATGRMGRAVSDLARIAGDIELVAGIAREASGDRIVALADAGPALQRAQAVIDFSAPDFLAELLQRHRDLLAERALVVGTTGLDEAADRELEALARSTPVLVAANFSPGVNLLLALVEQAAAALAAEAYDLEIVEAHHRRKIDAPSGTALALARAAARGRQVDLAGVRRDGRSGTAGERLQGEIGMHAVRGGDVIGEHRVLFLGERERVELAHTASDRSLFAEGALMAARWLAQREAGRYRMSDVLGLRAHS